MLSGALSANNFLGELDYPPETLVDPDGKTGANFF